MTPKKKAEKLCYDIALELPPRNGYIYAKQCALIAVDEFIEYLRWTQDYHLANYWREVKQEINNL